VTTATFPDSFPAMRMLLYAGPHFCIDQYRIDATPWQVKPDSVPFGKKGQSRATRSPALF
jgi:hypothetical protein